MEVKNIMKATYGNIVNQKRNKLEEVIPLETPYVIAIDPCNACNFTCKFCGIQQLKDRATFPFKCMDLGLYKKIIDDLAVMPQKVKMIRLAGNGEPLLNTDFCEMVRYAKKTGRIEWVETITNASMLTEELNSEIAESGLDRIRISIEEVDSEGYENITGTKVDFDQLVANIADLYSKTRGKCQIYVKTVDVSVRAEWKRDKFFEVFGNICDRIFVDTVIPSWSGFEEINEMLDLNCEVGVHGQEVRKVVICPFPYYSCKIHPDGIVTMCCGDWERKYVIGDINNSSFYDIWNGDTLRKFLIENAKGHKNNYEMCRRCLAPDYDSIDNLDDYADVILSKL